MWTDVPVCMVMYFVYLCNCSPVEKKYCGYKACNSIDPDAINVHIVPHSHNDVGWIKTVDQYYYGSQIKKQFAGVQYIIDSVVAALLENPDRKFIQVETAFLQKWWKEQPETKREQFRHLVNSGQLEIAGGGWSMNDEATVHYQSIIDQFTYGFKFLYDNLGECGIPKVGWQIDSFGHSREMAWLALQLGFEGMFFPRTDWREKRYRLQTNTAEILWQANPTFGKDSWLFTNIMYDHYSAPKGFSFDILSKDDPLVTDENSAEFNILKKVGLFADRLKKQSKCYVTNNILVPMGDDFTYQDAHYYYKNLDILIKAFNDTKQVDDYGRRFNLIYSTPLCYLKAVNQYAERKKTKFVIKADDFMPYSTDPKSYWTGYFTSRPTQKKFERQGNNLLQVSKQLVVLSGILAEGENKKLDELKSIMGTMQHHDAITGTAQQHVANDYARRMAKAMRNVHPSINKIIPKLLGKDEKENINLNLESCLLANVSHCAPSQKARFVVTLYNPLSRIVSYYVRLPVNSNKFTITGPEGIIPWQITPTIDSFQHVEGISQSKFDLVFRASYLPPLGIKLYYIVNEAFGSRSEDILPNTSNQRLSLGNNVTGFTVNPESGLIESAIIDGLKLPVRQEIMYYESASNSGAYVFRTTPDTKATSLLFNNTIEAFSVYKGNIVDELHQTFNKWTKQIIRVYKDVDNNHIEFDWLVGPLDNSNGNREVISRFHTSLTSETDCETDSNGRQYVIRRKGYRATYKMAANRAKHLQLAILTDRAQGGTSLNSGEIELMIHRRLEHDDGYGVSEALNEREFHRGLVVRGQHYLTFGSDNPSTPKNYTRRKQRDIAQRKLLQPWVFIGDATSPLHTLENLQNHLNFKFSGLGRNLENDDAHILTLEYWDSNTILLRLEHLIETSEGGEDVTINLADLFSNFKITSLKETTIGANQLLKTATIEKLNWNASSCPNSLEYCSLEKSYGFLLGEPTGLLVKLAPMQIRTFIATIEYLRN